MLKNNKNDNNRIIEMKTLFTILALCSAFGFEAQSQIVDNEASKNFLAVHCAVSGGRNANDYENYGRQLAKTLNLLSPKQQKAVFGFVPQPGAVSIPDYNPDLHGPLGLGLAGGGTGEEGNEAGSAPSGHTDSGNSVNPNIVVDVVGRFNDSINGLSNTGDAVIAGTAPDSGDSEESGDDGPSNESDSSGRNWIEGILSWIRGLSEN